MSSGFAVIMTIPFFYPPISASQGRPEDDVYPRPELAAGFGVSYMAVRDVVDLINATALPSERVPDFRAAAEFFGAVSYPVSKEWLLKFEYAYLFASYASASPFGQADIGVNVHLLSLLVQIVLADKGVYNLKLGAGGGVCFGSMSEKYVTIDDTYSGRGPAVVLEIEANTALGENLYAYLGGNIRWSFIGELSNTAGRIPGRGANGGGTTLSFFGAGARLGLSYSF